MRLPVCLPVPLSVRLCPPGCTSARANLSVRLPDHPIRPPYDSLSFCLSPLSLSVCLSLLSLSCLSLCRLLCWSSVRCLRQFFSLYCLLLVCCLSLQVCLSVLYGCVFVHPCIYLRVCLSV